MNFLNFFNLDIEDGLTCRHMHDAFSWEGAAGNINLYWQRKWDGTTYCYLDTWSSDYIIYYADDYKKCVCDAYLDGGNDCPQKVEPVLTYNELCGVEGCSWQSTDDVESYQTYVENISPL